MEAMFIIRTIRTKWGNLVVDLSHVIQELKKND